MGRKRLPENEKRENVVIRLPKWMILKIKEKGSITKILEELIRKYLKLKK